MPEHEPNRDLRHATPSPEGIIFDVDTFAVHDGPGVRMAVYLKGCPLACKWCHSPESQAAAPELIFVRGRCTLCGACGYVCPQGAHRVETDHVIDRGKCVACGRCVEECPHGALAIKGYRVPASSLVRRAERLRPFLRHYGGGVTLTGGEVASQPEFAAAVLAGCRTAGIHTAIETSGACRWPVLKNLLQHADLVLYDLKIMDEETHRRWTGVSNRQILENAARLNGREVQVRVPLIPGITDTEDNLAAIFDFMRDNRLRRAALLPYNPSSAAKYEWLGIPYEFDARPQSAEQLAELVALARRRGIGCLVA